MQPPDLSCTLGAATHGHHLAESAGHAILRGSAVLEAYAGLRGVMVSQGLLTAIRRGFALRLDSIHGESHWARVCENGLRLAAQTGADLQLVELFAYLHDSKRQGDGWDKGHGRRAADFVRSLNGSLLTLSQAQVECLAFACAHHSDGLTEADITAQTCWDADRLDLGRIGIKPDPAYLCTPAARNPTVIEWAFARSRVGW